MSKKRTMGASEEDIISLPSINGMVLNVKGQETVGHDFPKIKGKTVSETNTGSDVSDDDWSMFLKYAEEYQSKGEKGTVIWIDTDLKDTLDQLKKGELCYSLRHLVNAIIRTWIEENKEKLKTTMKTKKGLL